MAAVASINVTLLEMGFVYRLNDGPKLSRLSFLKEKKRKKKNWPGFMGN